LTVLLTCNSGFARDRLPGSPVTARFNEKRQDTSQSDNKIVTLCTSGGDVNSANDSDCLLGGESIIICQGMIRSGTQLADCLSGLCPNTDRSVINCVSDLVNAQASVFL
jgi:hypothetical protein